MADITVLDRKAYSGLDADKASVTGTAGDTYAATDTGTFYAWDSNASTWVSGGMAYVPRDVAAADKDQTDFTADGAWKVDGLDLSAIIPVGAAAINLKVTLNDDNVAWRLQIRQNAGAAIANLMICKIFIANSQEDYFGVMNCESDRKFDYNATNAPLTALALYVLGWWI